MRRLFPIAFAIAVMFTSSAVLFAQAPAKPKPAFEVVSIKPVGPFGVRPGIRINGNRFDCAMSLQGLISTAYGLKSYQLVGPDWINLQRFDITAIMQEGSSKDHVPEMLQALLEDRFKLKSHLEKKEQPAYVLVVPDKKNLKLMKADETVYSDAKPLSPTHPMSMKRDGNATILIDSRSGMVTRSSPDTRGGTAMMRMEILKTSMSALANYLEGFLDRPVVDATGLKDSYRMMLDLPQEVYRNAVMSRPLPADVATALRSPFSGQAGAPAPTDTPSENPSDPQGNALFAVIEKAGLKLDSRRVPIDTLIIEHVEKSPTEN